ncbi:signal recognition particle receptor beta subunit-domain-containing protein [Thamnocephalis sphaerospora]|uniref:Signal recognition particle receptor subunit beta n=1 Tax=Thamnocephalis sphaerospora TaxID=78915 RepID=A0A4P9XKU4_9FUNG|nr:signal recognition particle receptor beta subunit-domain-containing protein [Thamnocephalis sphaerospora]|eukprot:RKP06437.1 signal recognition particle receptor beta subunit-domain-containing protein [Thamnocephalis sphaerospora]
MSTTAPAATHSHASAGKNEVALFGLPALLLIVAIVSIAIAAVYLRRASGVKADSILLVGARGSGKTNMLARLEHDAWVETHTSLKDNSVMVALDDEGKLCTRVIDVPGHEKLRYQTHHFTPVARGIVFVLDAARLGKDIRQVAEYLYDILTDSRVAQREIPILLACHKADLATAYAPKRCREMLETEIDRIRVTRTAAVDSQTAEQEQHSAAERYLGYEGETFRFDHLPNDVQEVACSSLQETSEANDRLGSVKEWMADVAAGRT